MSDTAIKVENLSKRYILGSRGNAHDGLRHRIEEFARKPWRMLEIAARRRKAGEEEFWALKNVSFDIKQGEVVGVIGRNGAGKSTLLKILSRITEPTEGRIKIRGRVASLLEVGTGFHPELTGRENIYLNGAILGMSRMEIKRRFDEIVAFAEVERFLDTPVKRYSSGMYVRLAFAVAAHLEPEILVVDEVLAVGDAQFQQKCLGKMQEVSRQQGRTVLFVSHNMAAVLQLTRTGIVMEKGKLRFHGDTERAVENYVGAMASDACVFFDVAKSPRKYMGSQAARFVSFRFDKTSPIFFSNEHFCFYAKVRAYENIPRLRFSITIFTAEGIPVGSCFGAEEGGPRQGEEAEFEVTLPCPRLAPGHYYCGVAVGKGDHRSGHVDYDVVLETLSFEVSPEEGAAGTISTWTRGWGSVVFPDLIQKCISSGRSAHE
ncbi:ABC transporter ATP-binding protein [Pedosphaera parvula]|uniref:ABC transporter related-protein n=1 Tax=Pedosphaera parvula (strain Ellin514) TaxID=320771 RepID=B9XD31_PEDPL|nr:ABC transporter ATP-binding protein [Pedosphaera parvula]EEF62377.1 ABC transporter related-protein [Pedosphaera parvula Ellin514]